MHVEVDINCLRTRVIVIVRPVLLRSVLAVIQLVQIAVMVIICSPIKIL